MVKGSWALAVTKSEDDLKEKNNIDSIKEEAMDIDSLPAIVEKQLSIDSTAWNMCQSVWIKQKTINAFICMNYPSAKKFQNEVSLLKSKWTKDLEPL